jgi:hypothetical protein
MHTTTYCISKTFIPENSMCDKMPQTYELRYIAIFWFNYCTINNCAMLKADKAKWREVSKHTRGAFRTPFSL